MEKKIEKELTFSKIAIRLLKELGLLKNFMKNLDAFGFAFNAELSKDYRIKNMAEYCQYFDNDESLAKDFFMYAFTWDETDVNLMIWATINNNWTLCLSDEFYAMFGYDLEAISKRINELAQTIREELFDKYNIDINNIEIGKHTEWNVGVVD